MRDTSLKAFLELKKKEKLGEQEDYLYFVLCRYPNSTNNELRAVSGMEINAVSGRMNGLVKKGWVESNGKKICNITGKEVYQWRPIEIADIKINNPTIDMRGGNNAKI